MWLLEDSRDIISAKVKLSKPLSAASLPSRWALVGEGLHESINLVIVSPAWEKRKFHFIVVNELSAVSAHWTDRVD